VALQVKAICSFYKSATGYQPPLCIIPEISAQELTTESLGSILVLAVDYDVVLTE